MIINPPQSLEAIQAKLGALPQTDLPAVLLPVRLETRFMSQAGLPFLCVRIFPDDIHIDTHEPELTDDELRWGQHLWEQVWRSGGNPDLESALQAELAQRFGPGRAAWIALTLKPLNASDRPKTAVPDGTPLPVTPQYPTTKMRSASWTKPPQVGVLPDRWIVMGFRQGQRVLTALGEAIARPLQAGPDPQAPPPENLDDQTVLPVDQGMRWMVDFDAAVEQGMGLRIPLASMAEAEQGYDRLLVFGINASLSKESSAKQLESLLASHRYTDSLDFVPQGTPSNHTAQAPAGYSSQEPDQMTELISRRDSAAAADNNGAVTADALGIPVEVFNRLPHSHEQEQVDARAMNTVLWPATWGYLLRYGLNGLLTDTQIAQTRQHFCEFVRGRGSLPVLRIGRQPYGLLPVTSLDRYTPAQGELFGQPGVALLRNLRDRWRQALTHIPHVGLQSGDTPGQMLANILGMQATTIQVLARMAFDGALYGVFDPPGLSTPSDNSLTARHESLRRLLRDIGVNSVPADLPFARLMYTDQQQPFSDLLGAFAHSKEPLATPLLALQQASFAALNDNALVDLGQFEQTPFYQLLRHALLLAYADVAYSLQIGQGHRAAGSVRDPGLVDILADSNGAAESTLTPLRLLTHPPAPGQPPLAEVIPTLQADQPAIQPLEQVKQCLAHLATVPADRLDLLLRETLDLASHRLDAWLTSLATARLHQMRQRNPQGAILGGYGWVERVRLKAGRRVTSPPAGVESTDDAPLFEQSDNGGYIMAPSLTQASTAAILRSGYLNHASQNATDPFAIDLSSERVRLAEWLLAGVRQGQSLGVLLGYRFERSLKEANLANYIEPCRKIAPLGELYRLLAEKEAAETALQALQAQQAQALQTAQQQLRERQQQRDRIQSDLRAVNQTLATKQQRLSQLQQAHPNINQEIQTLENQRQPLLNQRQDLHNTLARLAELLDSGFSRPTIERQIANTQRDLDRVNGQIDAINASINQLNGLRTEMTQLPTEMAQLNSQKSSLQTSLTAAEQAVDAQHDVVDALPAQQAQARQPLEAQLKAATEAHHAFLDEYRNRYLYPPSASIEAIEAIEVQHGVDGLALMNLWQQGTIPFGTRGLPSATSTHGALLQAQLNQLVAMVDAVSDVVTAESVYQLAQGNELRAGATLDAIATGETPPPEPEVILTPRTGTAHTHRLMVVLPAASAAPVGWKTDSFQRRAVAEPALNAWVAELLVDPARVRIEATYLDPTTETPLGKRSARLSDFMLSPLDVLYLATVSETGTGSPLENQIAYRLLRSRPADVPAHALVRFSDDAAPDWEESDVSWGSFLEQARAVRALVTASRPLDARDLRLPEAETLHPHIDRADLQRRADAAVNQLRSAQRNLELERANVAASASDLDTLRGAFSRLFYLGFSEAVPMSAQGNDASAQTLLLEQATSLLESVNRRLTALAQLDASRTAASPATLVELDIQRLQTVFGADFRVLPSFQPTDRQPLQQSWDNSLSLQGGDPLAAIAWLDQMAHVRDGCQRLHTSLTYAEALNDPFDPALTVGQLPYTRGDRWVALPQPETTAQFSHTALVALIPHTLPTDAPLAGLLIDEWVETIPNSQEIAGVAFHFDAPQAQAPHAVLLAVPPNGDARWTLDTLGAIVQETLELAKLRTVDNAALFQESGSLPDLPALYLATNPAGDTISTDLSSLSVPMGETALPRLSGITPNSVARGQTVTLTLTGLLLAQATAVQFAGSGITIQSFEVLSDTQLTVRIAVSSSAPLGDRNFQVTTPQGVLQSQSFNLKLNIRPAPPPPPIHYGSFGRSAIGSDLL